MCWKQTAASSTVAAEPVNASLISCFNTFSLPTFDLPDNQWTPISTESVRTHVIHVSQQQTKAKGHWEALKSDSWIFDSSEKLNVTATWERCCCREICHDQAFCCSRWKNDKALLNALSCRNDFTLHCIAANYPFTAAIKEPKHPARCWALEPNIFTFMLFLDLET